MLKTKAKILVFAEKERSIEDVGVPHLCEQCQPAYLVAIPN
jgi:hypothetical protein